VKSKVKTRPIFIGVSLSWKTKQVRKVGSTSATSRSDFWIMFKNARELLIIIFFITLRSSLFFFRIVEPFKCIRFARNRQTWFEFRTTFPKHFLTPLNRNFLEFSNSVKYSGIFFGFFTMWYIFVKFYQCRADFAVFSVPAKIVCDQVIWKIQTFAFSPTNERAHLKMTRMKYVSPVLAAGLKRSSPISSKNCVKEND